ncbi:MAG: hypothetical protein A2289_11390 [Deltaproteobacteria bacterium RIFOXYA12_FULL_58_15]|nr:MAG: hypothetical protein A2289_11390 [Deltaproteobacteria bacterium RIFOXYA12_FULL_58_15]OGR10111.1 MAG: hypothetical protein A2341_21455 [Deltaproteobacteria bacterium RIFOXYB12_FULL_58_9]
MIRYAMLLLLLSGCHLFTPKPELGMILAVETTDPVVQQKTETTIRKRLANAEIRGSSVQSRPDGKLQVLLPRISDREALKELLTRQARLEFRLVDEKESSVFESIELPANSRVKRERETFDDGSSDHSNVEHFLVAPKQRDLESVLTELKLANGLEVVFGDDRGQVRTYLLGEAKLTNDSIESADIELDEMVMQYIVLIRFNEQGAQLLEKTTKENVRHKLAMVLDGRVISAPVIAESISGGSARISRGGLGNPQHTETQTRNLAAMLSAGALPVPVTIESERTLTQ